MGIENSNGKKAGPKRQGAGALKEFADIDKRIFKRPNAEISAASISLNDPKYEEVRSRFEKRNIPFNLMDYALGLKAMPRPDEHGEYATAEEAQLVQSMRKHNDNISRALVLASQAHIRRLEKSPDFASYWNKSAEAWSAKGAEGVGVPIPISSFEMKKTKDLAPMPLAIRERIQHHPAAVNYALAMFARQIRDWPFENEIHQKFARHFAEELENKAFRQSQKVPDRSRYNNAYWALLDLKVAEEIWDPKRKRKYPEIRIRADEIARHIEQFINSEQVRREKLPTLTGDEKAKAEAELAALPPNIIEAVGERLYVKARDLPITESELTAELEERAGDDAESVESRHLPSALRGLSRMLGRVSARVSMEAANAQHDTETMSAYLQEENEWSPSVQEGFDLLLGDVIVSLRSAAKLGGMVETATNHADMKPAYAPIFEEHRKNVFKLENELRATQRRLLTLWNEYHGTSEERASLEARITATQNEKEEMEQEAEDHLQALETLYEKLIARTDVDQAIRILGTYLGKKPGNT
jgi:hypothetical protein